MEYTELLEKQIIGRLQVDNPWWTENDIPMFYKEMSPRLYLNIFYPLVTELSIHRAIILMGPRRVGKTVILYHTIQKLIAEGVSPQNIIYISVETPIYNGILLEQLFMLCKQILNKPQNDKEQYYIFFDEIQYLKNWEVNLKSLVDTYHNVRFVASGSAAAELKKRSNESGAGRFSDFNLPPLTFYEYIHLKGYEHLLVPDKMDWYGETTQIYKTLNTDKLNQLFLDYINYGGYPEVVFSEKMRENPGQFIRHDIIDKVLLRDLPSLYGIQDVQELNSLFTMIAYHSGDQFSYEKMSKESGVKKEMIRKYIEYLEAAFLIRVIHRTDDTAKRYQRETTFKIYLTNPSLRCALFQPIVETDKEMGNMVETAVYAQWIPRHNTNITYANWRLNRKEQGEVDLVGINEAKQKPYWAVEIKWSDYFEEHPEELSSLLFFMKTNQLTQALVSTKTTTSTRTVNNMSIQFMPVACYAYLVGKNTLNYTMQSLGI
ncbi:MAG: ATP-binding protein [Paludibacteraceae bacterium]|nr:ATP-binding protein [Paludibacteraceae bacterium]